MLLKEKVNIVLARSFTFWIVLQKTETISTQEYSYASEADVTVFVVRGTQSVAVKWRNHALSS